MSKADFGDPFSVTATHATAAVASKAGATGKTHFVTHVAVSSDKSTSVMLIKQGTTTIWQLQIGAGKHEESFGGVGLAGVSGALVSVEIDGTSACDANLQGYTLNQ